MTTMDKYWKYIEVDFDAILVRSFSRIEALRVHLLEGANNPAELISRKMIEHGWARDAFWNQCMCKELPSELIGSPSREKFESYCENEITYRNRGDDWFTYEYCNLVNSQIKTFMKPNIQRTLGSSYPLCLYWDDAQVLETDAQRTEYALWNCLLQEIVINSIKEAFFKRILDDNSMALAIVECNTLMDIIERKAARVVDSLNPNLLSVRARLHIMKMSKNSHNSNSQESGILRELNRRNYRGCIYDSTDIVKYYEWIVKECSKYKMSERGATLFAYHYWGSTSGEEKAELRAEITAAIGRCNSKALKGEASVPIALGLENLGKNYAIRVNDFKVRSQVGEYKYFSSIPSRRWEGAGVSKEAATGCMLIVFGVFSCAVSLLIILSRY